MKTFVKHIQPGVSTPITLTKTEGELLVLHTTEGTPVGEGWEEIKTTRLQRISWRLKNAWDALRGREPSY